MNRALQNDGILVTSKPNFRSHELLKKTTPHFGHYTGI